MVKLLFVLVLSGCATDTLCEQRWAWEATGHDYVGVPAGADYCGRYLNG
jgi:hypothetical protein